MSAVPLVDADGHEPLPICRRHREWLIDYYKGPDGVVLRYFSDAVPSRRKDHTEDERSVKHLRECPRCRAWVSTIVPDAQYRRQARLARYCCAGMFCAVEEHDARGSPRFSFDMFAARIPAGRSTG